METPIRKQTRDDQGKPENLVPQNTALPPDIVELVEAEAAFEFITPSQVLRRIVNDTAFAKKPNLRVKDFAELAGKSRWTIMKDVRLGKIRKINGRIPRDQLSKYTS
jgi:hypothetical protein